MNVRRAALYTLIVVLLLAAGCRTTRQTRSVETSGFLGDYSQLEEGKRGQAQLVYVNPRADFSRYDAVLLDSVTVWQAEGSKPISDEDAQVLTDYFYNALHEEISKDFQVTAHPGPGVLRLRAALTEAKGARVVGNAVTSIVPQLRLLSTITGAITDVQVFVGRASAEAEITDSLTGERLLAAVDQRSGTKALRSGLLKWSDVKEISKYWAERVRERLGELGVRKSS